MWAEAAEASSKDTFGDYSQMTRQTKYPLTKLYTAAESTSTKAVCNESEVISTQCIILSEFANIPLSTSEHGKWKFMHPPLYHSLLFFFSPVKESRQAGRYFHQRQYPVTVIISEQENGSLTYARHVKNLQAPFVDASRQCAAPIRMVSPVRMHSPHFHRRQSSHARFLRKLCVWQKNTHTGLSEYGNHEGHLSVMDAVCVCTRGGCAHILSVVWND